MALFDFACPRCGYILRDHNVPISLGAVKGAPLCRLCEEMDDHPVAMEYIPQIGLMDAGSGSTFKTFETYDAFNKKKITVSSLSQLRKLESESEVRARNGEGQHVVWPAYSNEPSNMDKHAIHSKWTDHPDLPPPGKRGVTIRTGEDIQHTRAASPDEGS